MADQSSADPATTPVKAVVRKKKNSKADVRPEAESDSSANIDVKSNEAAADPVIEQPTTSDAVPEAVTLSPPSPPASVAAVAVEEEQPVAVPAKRVSDVSMDPSSARCRHYDMDLIPRDELTDLQFRSDRMIQDLQDRLSHEEDAAANLSSSKKKLEGDISNLKKDLENLELSLQKVRAIVKSRTSG